MQAFREILTVSESRKITLSIPIEYGDDIEVIILPHVRNLTGEKSIPLESLYKMKLEESSGYLQALLNDPDEDIWNE